MTYVMLEPNLIKEVAAELDFLSEAEVEFSVELVEALIEELLDAEPFCDHSVGICACSTQGVIEALRGALVGMKDCPACFGDTYVYVEYHQPICWEALQRIGDCQDVHMVRCGCWHGKVFEPLHIERTADAPRRKS